VVKGVFSVAQIRFDPITKIKIRTISLMSEDLLNEIMDPLLVSLVVVGGNKKDTKDGRGGSVRE